MTSVLIGIALVFGFMASAKATVSESEYFKARDKYLRELKKSGQTGEIGGPPLPNNLAEQIRSLVGTFRIEGQTKPFRPVDMNEQLIDGLSFLDIDHAIFVTTEPVLKNYLRRHPEIQSSKRSAAFDRKIYLSTISEDADVMTFAEISNASATKGDRAFLALVAQDIGLFVPGKVVTYAVRAGRVFIQMHTLAGVQQIPACAEKYEAIQKRADSKFNEYKKSRAKKHFEEYQRLNEKAFDDYRKCFTKLASKQKWFESAEAEARRQIQSIKVN